MKKFEYKTIHAIKEALYDHHIEAHKNTLGQEGWELVAVEHPCYYFKREIQQEQKDEIADNKPPLKSPPLQDKISWFKRTFKIK